IPTNGRVPSLRPAGADSGSSRQLRFALWTHTAMSDPTPCANDAASTGEAPAAGSGTRAWFKATAARLRDWLAIQTPGMKLAVLGVALMIPASAYYAWSTLERQQKLSLEVKAMAAGQGAEAAWAYNTALPVVFGSGSVLSFLETHPVARITII